MLSDRIRALRKEHGYSQEQMARKLHLTQGAISQWENGLTVPAADQLMALADVFGITVDDLLGREQQETPPPPARDDVAALMADLTLDEQAQVRQYAEFLKSTRKAD
jgi:transcriptional regulator with XRE-family HTH domain